MSKPDPMMIALSSMVVLPQWDDFLAAFQDRRDQWKADSNTPAVYQSHAELVHVHARIAECDYWLEVFKDAKRKVAGQDGPG